MTYLLDTNMVSRLIREEGNVKVRMQSLPKGDVAVTCTIARGEILFGIESMAPGRKRLELAAKVARLFATLACLQVPDSAAERYASIKQARKRLGRPILENDCWIASSAMAIGAILVSHGNDVQGITGLTVEDWW